MLGEKEIEEVKEWLNKSQNPLFFFDNDVDGLCSFLLLRRHIQRGFGIVVKSYPSLDAMYNKKIDELKPDVIFILDKPEVSDEFIDYANQSGLPIVWIDHHPLKKHSVDELRDKNVFYYNPLYSKKPSSEPTSYWCYKIAGNKNDLWISVVGCVSDQMLPESAEEFSKKYPDLLAYTKNPAKALFKSEIGKLSRILSYALKDKTSNVIRMLKKLWEVKSPYEILNGDGCEYILERYSEIDKKYSDLLSRAKQEAGGGKLLYFQYSGDLSISADLSNELAYLYPDKIIAVVFIKGDRANLSLRGKTDVRKILEIIMEKIGGTGGGHKHACGGTISVKDLQRFKSNIADIVK